MNAKFKLEKLISLRMPTLSPEITSSEAKARDIKDIKYVLSFLTLGLPQTVKFLYHTIDDLIHVDRLRSHLNREEFKEITGSLYVETIAAVTVIALQGCALYHIFSGLESLVR